MLVLDVRQQDEYDAGRVDKAVLIPMNVLPDRYSEPPKDKPIVVYCRSAAKRRPSLGRLARNGVPQRVQSLQRLHGLDGVSSNEKIGRSLSAANRFVDPFGNPSANLAAIEERIPVDNLIA